LRWTTSCKNYRIDKFPDDGDPVYIVMFEDGRGWRVSGVRVNRTVLEGIKESREAQMAIARRQLQAPRFSTGVYIRAWPGRQVDHRTRWRFSTYPARHYQDHPHHPNDAITPK